MKRNKISSVLSLVLASVIVATSVNVDAFAANTKNETAEELLELEDGSELLVVDETKETNEIEVINDVVTDSNIEESLEEESTELFKDGYVEAPWESDFISYGEALDRDGVARIEAALPAKYDPRTSLPATRNQGSYGTCWAHSTMALAEIGQETKPDFSELHLAYFSFNTTYEDPLGGLNGDSNAMGTNSYSKSGKYLDNGGNQTLAGRILYNWIGVANEDVAPYSTAPSVLSRGISPTEAYNDTLHIKGMYYSDPINDIEGTKNLIYQYGAVGVGYYALQNNGKGIKIGDNSYFYENVYKPAYNSYYFPEKTGSTNHAVTIVGWDDDFPKEHFVTEAPGNGAWLVRNSWSTDSSVGYKAYFWMSYYDGSLRDDAVAMEFEESSDYDNNYQYDGSMTWPDTSFYVLRRCANIFTTPLSSKGEEIKAVAFEVAQAANSGYVVNVYRNLSDSTNPESGELVATTNGKITYDGYYTVKLPQSVELEAGDTFSVVVAVDAGYIAMEGSVSGTGYNTVASISEGQSYYYSGKWYDYATGELKTSRAGNFRIKAFTTNSAPIVPVDVTVYYDANGGECTPTSGIQTTGTVYSDLPEPTRDGYTFDGWFTSEIGGTKVIADSTVVRNASDHTLYAQWTPNTYTVTFSGNGGSPNSQARSIKYDSAYGGLPSATRTGYDFAGWYTLASGGDKVESTSKYTIAGNSTVYAHWTPKQYTVTFKGNGGSPDSQTKSIYYDSAYGELPSAARTGYDFAGWYTASSGGTKITEGTKYNKTTGTTLYAQWTAKQYTVNLHTNTAPDIVDEIKVTYDQKYGAELSDGNAPKRPGYTFLGWYTGSESGNKITEDTIVKITSMQDLYAHWELTKYELSFVAEPGSVTPSSKVITYGNAYGDLPTPVLDGAPDAFLGWYTASVGGTEVTSGTVLTSASNQIVYAHWNLPLCDISLDANGGEVSKSSIKAYYTGHFGDIDRLPTPVKVGYSFVGWKDKSTNIIVNNDTVVSQNRAYALEAVWKALQITVSFETNGGIGECDPITVEYGQRYGTLPAPTKFNSEFDGWYLDNTLTNKVLPTTIMNSVSNHKLYAKWVLKYTVSTPVASVAPGEVRKGTKVSLSTDTDDARIIYTLDPAIGSAGKETIKNYGQLYMDAITIQEAVTVYAIAIRDEYNDSDVLIATYTVKDESHDWGDIDVADRVGFESADDVPNGLWVAGIPKSVDFNGVAQTFSDIHVYHHKSKLVLNTDYSVKYKNNTKAGIGSITISGKNNYSDSVVKSFTIKPLKLDDGMGGNNSMLLLPNIRILETGKPIFGTTEVSYTIDGKSVVLKKGTDFTYEYEPSKDYISAGEYLVTIRGKGNYYGTATFSQIILPQTSAVKPVAKLKIEKIATQASTGVAIEPNIVIMDGDYQLQKGTDFIVNWTNNINPGTANAIVTGIDKYSGTKVVTFKIAALPISKAIVTKVYDKSYTGEAIEQSAMVVSYMKDKLSPSETLVLGQDYTVEYSNNVNASKKATILIKGKGKYAGTLKKTFAIVPKDINTVLSSTVLGSYSYTKGGVKPQIDIMDGLYSLVEKKDYTVSYANNKAVGGIKTPVVTYKGKGNYAGTVTKTFRIEPSSLENEGITMVVSDIVYTNKAGTCKPKFVVYDADGVKLAAGTDYDKKAIDVKYAKDVPVVYHDAKFKQMFNIVRMQGEDVDVVHDIIPAGAEIEVTVHGIGNYDTDSVKSAIFRYVKADISKATVATIEPREYTGNPIEITKSDIVGTIKIGGQKYDLDYSDFEIVGYTNNIKKGTAKVTIKGTGRLGGTKTISFKIKSKTVKTVQ